MVNGHFLKLTVRQDIMLSYIHNCDAYKELFSPSKRIVANMGTKMNSIVVSINLSGIQSRRRLQMVF